MRLFYLSILISAFVNGQFYGPDDFRISDAGGFGSTSTAVDFPDMAYNPMMQNYLVVWESDDTDQIGVVDNNSQIIGRYVDLNGIIQGNDFLISALNLGSNSHNNEHPRVAYNTVNNNFMVVYEGELNNGNNEIYAVLVNNNGTIITSDFRISTTASGEGRYPAVAYNSILNEYLVVYVKIGSSSTTTNPDVEIQGQRLSNTGNLIGSSFPITNSVSGAQTNGSIPDVIYNSVSNDYVVTYVASPLTNEEEAFTTLVSQTGIVGVTTRLSNRGSIDANGFANKWVRTAWDQVNDQYLFVYEADNSTAGEIDVFGVIYNSTMNLIVPEFEISMVAGSSTLHDAVSPDVEWLPGDNNFYVVFRANPIFSNRNEYEIYMRSVTSAGVIGANLLRVSSAPVDEAGSARFPRISSNGQNAILTVYAAEDTSPASMMVDREYEVYGQFYGSSSLSIENENTSFFNVYPNPVKNSIVVEGDNQRLLSYSIVNAMGVEILKVKDLNSSLQTIDLSHFSAGWYLIKITSDNHSEVHKVLKK